MSEDVTSPLFDQDAGERHGLVSILTGIHNALYANDGLSPEQALEETIKLLFLKFVDESSSHPQFSLTRSEKVEIAASGMSSSFEDRLKKLSIEVFGNHPELFEIGERLKVKVTSLALAVEQLSRVQFHELPHDVKGAAFQLFLSASQRVGRGQFFTPEPVVDFCVAALDPKAGEVVVDPACGSGGFLAAAFLSSIKNGGKGCRPVGFEISKTAARLARMRMLLLEAETSEIHRTDSLLEVDELLGLIQLGSIENVDQRSSGFADVVLTNPPFGTQGKINDRSVLQRFELGHRWESAPTISRKGSLLGQQVPEILFIEQCVRILRPGGRLGIVLPNGEFENSSLQYVRDFLIRNIRIDSIVKLPQETFVPSGTGIKTSLLFGTKLQSGERESRDHKVFFGEVKRLGYQGNKLGTAIYLRGDNGQVQLDETLRPVIDEDFSEILSAMVNRNTCNLHPENSKCFEVMARSIDSSRFDYEFHHPRYMELLDRLRSEGAQPLSSLVQIAKGKAQVLADVNAIINYVELSDVGVEYQEIINCEQMRVFDLPSRASFVIREGQLVFAVAGNSIGTVRHASALVTREFDGAICSNGFRVFDVDSELVDPYFLLFALASDAVLQQVFRLRTGAAIPSISDVDLQSVLIPRFSPERESEVASIVRQGFRSRILYREQISNCRS